MYCHHNKNAIFLQAWVIHDFCCQSIMNQAHISLCLIVPFRASDMKTASPQRNEVKHSFKQGCFHFCFNKTFSDSIKVAKKCERIIKKIWGAINRQAGVDDANESDDRWLATPSLTVWIMDRGNQIPLWIWDFLQNFLHLYHHQTLPELWSSTGGRNQHGVQFWKTILPQKFVPSLPSGVNLFDKSQTW